jgi:hypothetical protein
MLLFARHRGVNYPGVSSVRMMRSHAQAFTHVETRQEVIMTELSTHTELLNKGTNGALAGRLLSGALIIGFALAAALTGATFGTPSSGSIGEAETAKAFADSRGYGTVSAVETTKIVPADSLRTNVSWSPLTGDGSN